MSDDKALVPVEEKTVDFYGDQITVVLVDDESGGGPGHMRCPVFGKK